MPLERLNVVTVPEYRNKEVPKWQHVSSHGYEPRNILKENKRMFVKYKIKKRKKIYLLGMSEGKNPNTFFFLSGTFSAHWRNHGPKNIVSMVSVA